MKVFAISDLHLSTSVSKPMDVFGDGWVDHFEKIKADWQSKVSKDDLVLLGGDISWASNLDEAESDFELLKHLSGTKVVCKGNHDYWWSTLTKISNRFPYINFIQNNCFVFKNYIIVGTRGWNIINDSSTEEDKKIYEHELFRLELSLRSAKAVQRGEKIIALLHFPPFDADFKESEATKMLESYGVTKALYGHLHGKNVRVIPKMTKNGVEYILTSCDLIDYKLVEVDSND